MDAATDRHPFAAIDAPAVTADGCGGVEFAQPPKKESWATSAIFKDPDGNSFVLGES